MRPELEADVVTLEEWAQLEAEAHALRALREQQEQQKGAGAQGAAPAAAAVEDDGKEGEGSRPSSWSSAASSSSVATEPPAGPACTLTLTKTKTGGSSSKPAAAEKGGVPVTVAFHPPPCAECKAGREAARNEYFQVAMTVKKRTPEEQLLHKEDPQQQPQQEEADQPVLAPGQRPPRATRSSRRGGAGGKGPSEVQVVVSSDDSVEMVHLRVAHSGLFAEEDFALLYGVRLALGSVVCCAIRHLVILPRLTNRQPSTHTT